MMRIRTIYGDTYEFFWDSQGRLRLWIGYGSLERRGELGNTTVLSVENYRDHGERYLDYTYEPTDDHYGYGESSDSIGPIQAIFVRGEEVMIP